MTGGEGGEAAGPQEPKLQRAAETRFRRFSMMEPPSFDSVPTFNNIIPKKKSTLPYSWITRCAGNPAPRPYIHPETPAVCQDKFAIYSAKSQFPTQFTWPRWPPAREVRAIRQSACLCRRGIHCHCPRRRRLRCEISFMIGYGSSARKR